MNIQHALERLQLIADEIRVLNAGIVDRERAAMDLIGTDVDAIRANERLDTDRARLKGLLTQHFLISAVVHGDILSQYRKAA